MRDGEVPCYFCHSHTTKLCNVWSTTGVLVQLIWIRLHSIPHPYAAPNYIYLYLLALGSYSAVKSWKEDVRVAEWAELGLHILSLTLS